MMIDATDYSSRWRQVLLLCCLLFRRQGALPTRSRTIWSRDDCATEGIVRSQALSLMAGKEDEARCLSLTRLFRPRSVRCIASIRPLSALFLPYRDPQGSKTQTKKAAPGVDKTESLAAPMPLPELRVDMGIKLPCSSSLDARRPSLAHYGRR